MGEARAPGHRAARRQARRQLARLVRPGAQRVPVRRAGLRRQPRALRGSAQQLPERGARAPHRHPDHAVGRLHGSGAARRAARRRRQLPRPLPGALPPSGERAGAASSSIRSMAARCSREHDCRMLLQRHVGSEVAFSQSLLAPATRPQMIVRMLLNLKRIYVHMRSFPQARDVTELLLALTPSALSELRDRGLLAYHLNDVTGRAARPADLPEAGEHERDGQGRARRARADLGAREDAPPPRRLAQLTLISRPVSGSPAKRPRCGLRCCTRQSSLRSSPAYQLTRSAILPTAQSVSGNS